ncbi:MAG: helix-turn-helix transcriptional regulator [Planctomycetes bacterium]|nr:helix-turn-helix transcriptional regulator [Planctomycetota bacterium]
MGRRAVPDAIRIFYEDPPVASRELRINGFAAGEWMAPSLVDRPRGTGDWLLMAFHQGVDVGFEGDVVRVGGAFLMVWSPRQGHYYGRGDQRWCHSWIHCDGALVERLVATEQVPTGVPIHGFDPADVDRCVVSMHDEIQRRGDPDATIVGNLLHNLLRAAARSASSARPCVPPGLLAVRRHIEANFTQRLTLAGLSARAGCSAQHLCAQFKRHFAVSPIDFAIRLRLHRARVLLSDRNRRVAEVAALVGYDDVPHFSRLFHKRYGASPGATRRSPRA